MRCFPNFFLDIITFKSYHIFILKENNISFVLEAVISLFMMLCHRSHVSGRTISGCIKLCSFPFLQDQTDII